MYKGEDVSGMGYCGKCRRRISTLEMFTHRCQEERANGLWPTLGMIQEEKRGDLFKEKIKKEKTNAD